MGKFVTSSSTAMRCLSLYRLRYRSFEHPKQCLRHRNGPVRRRIGAQTVLPWAPRPRVRSGCARSTTKIPCLGRSRGAPP